MIENNNLQINILKGNIEKKDQKLSGNIELNTKLSGHLAMPSVIKANAKWGTITGDIEDQEDLISYLSVIDCGSSTEVV